MHNSKQNIRFGYVGAFYHKFQFLGCKQIGLDPPLLLGQQWWLACEVGYALPGEPARHRWVDGGGQHRQAKYLIHAQQVPRW